MVILGAPHVRQCLQPDAGAVHVKGVPLGPLEARAAAAAQGPRLRLATTRGTRGPVHAGGTRCGAAFGTRFGNLQTNAEQTIRGVAVRIGKDTWEKIGESYDREESWNVNREFAM